MRRDVLFILSAGVCGLLYAGLWSASGCGGSSAARSPVSGGGSTTPSGETVIHDPVTRATVDNEFLKVEVTLPEGKSSSLHVAGQPWNAACQIDRSTATSDTAHSDLICILEALELDLFSFDAKLQLNYNVPKDLCGYVKVFPYYFYQKQGGVGPSAVSMTVTTFPDGTQVSQITSVTDVTPGITAELDSDGALTCTANHKTGVFQANCCEGDYVLTTTTNGVPSTLHANWEGNASNCLVGPAVATQEKDENGFPRPDHIDVSGIGLNRPYEIASPEGLNYFTNLYLANFFDISSSFDADGKTFHYATAPAAIRGPQDPGDPDRTFDGKDDHHNAWYEFSCLDQADDYIYRIRLMIRSWSTQEQFDAANEASFNAGVGGDEETYFKQQYLLDRCGWFDATGGKCGVLGNLLDDPLDFPGDNL